MRSQAACLLICATVLSCLAHAGEYQSVQIVSPEHNTTVHDNSGNLSVTIAILPPLHAEDGDYLILSLDGKSVASGSSQVYELQGIDRGSHTLRVLVKAADGAVLATSPPVEFHMWRASRHFRKRSN